MIRRSALSACGQLSEASCCEQNHKVATGCICSAYSLHPEAEFLVLLLAGSIEHSKTCLYVNSMLSLLESGQHNLSWDVLPPLDISTAVAVCGCYWHLHVCRSCDIDYLSAFRFVVHQYSRCCILFTTAQSSDSLHNSASLHPHEGACNCHCRSGSSCWSAPTRSAFMFLTFLTSLLHGRHGDILCLSSRIKSAFEQEIS